MARMRTMTNAIKELKKDDPNCDLTYSALRRMVLNNEIPHLKIGTRTLIDIDDIKEVMFKKNGGDDNEIK